MRIVECTHSYEPLEVTLQKFRVGQEDASVNEALCKLLALELEELIEHPQWQEVLSITLYYLSVSGTLVSDLVKIKCMKFLLRLAMGLPGHQAYEATMALLSYLFHDLSTMPSSSCMLPPSQIHRVKICKKALEKDLYYAQVSCLSVLLCYNATGEDSEGIGMARHFLSLCERDIARLMSLVFIILTTRGYVSSLPSGNEHVFVPIMDLIGLTRFGPNAFNPVFVSSWQKLSIQPTVISHSFATGFASFLSGRLQQESYVLLKELEGSSKSSDESLDSSYWDYCVRIWSFYAVVWTGLVSPHIDREKILDTLLLLPTDQSSEYPLEKLYSFSLNHQTPEYFGLVPKLSVVENFNKNYYQLEGKTHYLQQFMEMVAEPSSLSMKYEGLSSVVRSTISLVSRVLSALIDKVFSDLYCVMEAICAIYSSILTKAESHLDRKDIENMNTVINRYLHKFLSCLEETTTLDEVERKMEGDILEQNHVFFDTIMQVQGDIIANILSKSHSLSPSFSKYTVQTRLDIFLPIVYAKKAPFHPVTSFTMGMLGNVANVEAIISLIDASFIMPARLCDYSMMILELLNTDEHQIENTDEICEQLWNLLKRCLDLIEMVISTSDGVNNYQLLQEYLMISPPLRTLCGFICRFCKSESIMTRAIESHRMQKTDLVIIDMIIACNHVYNCRQKLKYSVRESEEAFISRISGSIEWNEESLSVYTSAFGQELQQNKSDDGNNCDGSNCIIVDSYTPSISYFISMVISLIRDGGVFSTSPSRKMNFDINLLLLGYSLFAHADPIFAAQLDEIDSGLQAVEKRCSSFKLYDIRTIARFLCNFIQDNGQHAENFIQKIKCGNEASWNCLRTIIVNTAISHSYDLCNILLHCFIPDVSSCSHDHDKEVRSSRLLALLENCKNQETNEQGQQKEQLNGFTSAKISIIQQLLEYINQQN